ncbi:MAG: Calcium-binding component of the spindle pole body (SPB) half-bridge [Caeruleum heppii]|nr:MAG: Calcium-binding component of the spindle pole body (SPB) half-bridge [Caeruleum heppii]
MASAAAAHPSFPSRSYGPNLGKLPDRSVAFGSSSRADPNRDGGVPRPDRNHERAERERLEREGQSALAELSDEQREEITEAFSLFDLDKDKHLDYHETKVAMKALGFDLPKQELVSILQTHGVQAPSPHNAPKGTDAPPNNTGVVTAGGNKPSATTHVPTMRLLLSFSSFQAIMASRILARDPRDEVLRAFGLFDEGNKGIISIDDLRRVARELGEGLEEEELVAMIDEFDLDGDGGISSEEFVAICLQ